MEDPSSRQGHLNARGDGLGVDSFGQFHACTVLYRHDFNAKTSATETAEWGRRACAGEFLSPGGGGPLAHCHIQQYIALHADMLLDKILPCACAALQQLCMAITYACVSGKRGLLPPALQRAAVEAVAAHIAGPVPACSCGVQFTFLHKSRGHRFTRLDPWH